MGTLVQAHIIVYGMKYIATGENLTFILNEPLFMTIYKHVALPHHFCSLAIIGVQIITPAIRRYRHCDCDNCIRLVTAHCRQLITRERRHVKSGGKAQRS